MAGGGPYNLGFRNERMKHILLEAQDRWLRYDDVIEILKNYQNADISAEHPNKPASGSVFLFDRKALRNFLKDRHNWIRNKHRKEPRFTLKVSYPESPLTDESHYSQSSSYNPLSRPGEIAFRHETCCSLPAQANWECPTMNQNLNLNIPSYQENEHQQNYSEPVCILPHKQKEQLKPRNLQMLLLDIETANASNPDMENILTTSGNKSYPYILKRPLIRGLQNEESLKEVDSISSGIAKEHAETDEISPSWACANLETKDDKIENGLFSEEELSAIESIIVDDTFKSWAFQ